jgi:hypothetical protein
MKRKVMLRKPVVTSTIRQLVILLLAGLCGAFILFLVHWDHTSLPDLAVTSPIVVYESRMVDGNQSQSSISSVALDPTKPVVADTSQYPPTLAKSMQLFASTLKSCLGTYCTDEPYIVAGGGMVKRIGILSPYNYPHQPDIHSILTAYPLKDTELAFTSHVPPYGYGKNHGWSRIVRIVDNVARQAYEMALESSGNTTSPDTLAKHFAAQVKT